MQWKKERSLLINDNKKLWESYKDMESKLILATIIGFGEFIAIIMLFLINFEVL